MQCNLGGRPRISIYSQIEVFRKNKRSHIGNIDVYAICKHYFYENNEELGTGKRVYETPQMHSRTSS